MKASKTTKYPKNFKTIKYPNNKWCVVRCISMDLPTLIPVFNGISEIYSQKGGNIDFAVNMGETEWSKKKANERVDFVVNRLATMGIAASSKEQYMKDGWQWLEEC